MKKYIFTTLASLLLLAVNAQDSTFTGLENRVNIKLPSVFSKKLDKTNIMGPLPSDREYVEYIFKKDSINITISVQELYAKADDNILSDIKMSIKNWSKMGSTYNIDETTTVNGITFYKIVPDKLLTERATFIKEAYFIQLPDNSLLNTFTLVNKATLDQKYLSQEMTADMSKIISVGSRLSNKKGDEIKIELADTTLGFTMPFDGIVSPRKGYSYIVVKVLELSNLNGPGSEFSLYYGRHPQHILNELPDKIKVNFKNKNGTIFGNKVKWQYCHPKPDQNYWFMQECFYSVNDAFILHSYIQAKSKADAKLLEKTITQLRKI
jgi:hypothetical protein